VQILVYNCDPKEPSISDIAKVTDYVVAYSCKGNQTLKEEREQTKQLILAMDEATGDTSDLTRAAKKSLNWTTARRLISKQEAMVLLADLPLTTCSDTIESVSISNSFQISSISSEVTNKTFLKQYKTRPSKYHNMSLIEYFDFIKNKSKKPAKNKRRHIIPHFVGINGSPKFPVTQNYAKHTLIVYKPWHSDYPDGMDWIPEFNNFINSPDCPHSARLPYDRIMQRYYDKMMFYEPVSKDVDHSGNPVSATDAELLNLMGLKRADEEFDEKLIQQLHKGMDFKWDQPPKVRFSYLKYMQI